MPALGNTRPRPVIRQKPKPKVKPKPTGGSAVGSSGVQKRAQDRLSRIIARGGKAPAGVKPGRPVTIEQAKAIKAEILRINAERRKKKTSAPASDPFDPLKPLTGDEFTKELGAAERNEFGEQDRALGNAYDTNRNVSELTGSYYDQYRNELAAAAGRMRAYQDQNIQDAQGRVDTAFQQDSTAAAARTQQANNQINTLGLQGTVTPTGEQQAEAVRGQGNAGVTELRDHAVTSNDLMENRQPTAIQAKAEALSRLGQQRMKLDEDQRRLGQAKGDFATNYRTKARESEREWAAIQEEFGLKKAAADEKSAEGKANRKLEAQKLATQKLVAQIYASADKASARAQVRVAKLQLQKGKIDQHQYNEIVNIYKGLPKKGSSPQAKPKPKGKFQTWEIDKIDNAVRILTKNKAKITPGDKATWMDRMQAEGISARLARAAWDRYVKNYNSQLQNQNRPH